MKKLISLSAIIFGLMLTFAQAPEKFSYQAVIRNASNALITNAPVGVKISILKTSVAGTVVYAESQTASTNQNGLISLQIGSGTVITGTISGINWASDLYFIKTETDPAGGTNYTIAGTTQLLSVPYALYAKNAGGGPAFLLPYAGSSSTPNTTTFSIINSGTTQNSAGTFETSNPLNTAPALKGKNVSTNSFGIGIEGRANSSTNGNISVGVRGIVEGTGGAGAGVYGSAQNAYGVYGTTDKGAGVLGYSTGTGVGGYFKNDGIGYALYTTGSVNINGLGESAGRVLTSDNAGNASWQDLITPFVHFSSFGGSSQPISIGSSPTIINTWTGLEETGGFNYNGTTGEYTIPVTGYYRLSTQISFENSNTQNGNQSYVVILVDNIPLKAGFGDQAVTGKYYTDSSVMVEKMLTVGQKVKVAVTQDGRSVNTLYGPATSFSINLLHK